MQPLQSHVGRRLVTMEKCLSWEEYERGLTAQEHVVVEQEKLKLHDNFRERYFNAEYGIN